MTRHYLDVIDRMEHELGMVEYLQNNTQSKDLEGVLAVLAERMRATKEMFHGMLHDDRQVE